MSRPLALLWLILLIPVLVPVAGAEPATPAGAAATEARLAALDPEKITPVLLEQARLEAESARIRLESLTLDRRGAAAGIEALQTAIRDTQVRQDGLKSRTDLSAERLAEELRLAEEELARHRSELEQEQQRLAGLSGEEERARAELERAERWQAALQEAYRHHQEQTRREALADRAAHLAEEEKKLLERADKASAQLARAVEEGAAEEERTLLKAEIQDAEERARLKRGVIRMGRMAVELKELNGVAEQEVFDFKGLSKGVASARGLRQELATSATLLQGKLAVIRQQVELLAKRRGLEHPRQGRPGRPEQLLLDLAGEMERQLAEFEPLRAEAERITGLFEGRLASAQRQGLTARHHLPSQEDEWAELASATAQAPLAGWRYLATLTDNLVAGLGRLEAGRWLQLLLYEGLLLGAWRLLRRLGRRDRERVAATRGVSIALLLEAVRWMAPRLTVIGAVLILAWAVALPAPQLRLLVSIGVLWLSMVAIRLAAWSLFAAPWLEADRLRPWLYRHTRLVTAIGGLLGATALLFHWSSLPRDVLDLLDRSMLALLLLIVPLLISGRRVLDTLLAERFARRFWAPAVRLLLLLVPLAVLFGATLAAAGFLNLGRAIFGGVGWLALVAVAWLLLLGLVRDGANFFKDFAQRHSHNGLLWAQGVIDPLRGLANLMLLLLAGRTLFDLYGWGPGSPVVESLRQALRYPLFQVGEAAITPKAVLVAVLAILVVVWLGHWAREITYRWLYVRVTDLGIRRSLSNFTQYAVVTFGALLALNGLGLDLTTLTVFAGALGVGLGLGLQNIANNFVSGLILLAEQPLRTGDYVSLAGKDGEVTRFGIRSVTVRTWDNQEVIIPNAEVVSNPFTNWTHSDNIMRNVLMIGVSYDDDPHRVQSLIRRILADHPAVLDEPKFDVFLWEFADSSVNYRVQYYIDLRQFSLLTTRSEVMFGIWDALKAEGFTIPYPQRDLHIKGWPAGEAGLQRG